VASCVGSLSTGASVPAGGLVGADGCGAQAATNKTKTVIKLKAKYRFDTAFLSSGRIT